MAFNRLKSHKKQFIPPKLHITAMMDMFTIILIFLLFSFSNEPETISLKKDLELPESNVEQNYKESIKLVLSKTNLQLEDKVIAEIVDGKIVGLNPKFPKKSKLYKNLWAYRQKALAQKSEFQDNHILFLCDKHLPFKTIKDVINTAGLAGYPNFQFAVLNR